MNNSAIISMVIIQGLVTVITLRIFYLVMRPQKKKKQERSNE